MKIIGIIAEYNPFHNGHAYLVQQARKLAGADYVIAVMSGDYVQRGTPAIFDKYARTRMALSCGGESSPDLIVELPVAAATGSAQRFAEGAAAILNALGCVDELWFGSEAGDIEPFKNISKILTDENQGYRDALRKNLKAGKSFPAAREAALRLVSDQETLEQLPSFLNSPNNILGLEYCAALIRTESSIRPCTVRRIGCDYASTSFAPDSSYNSASAIRRKLLSGDMTHLEDQMPEEAYKIMEGLSSDGIRPLTEDDFSLILKYQLMRETRESLPDILDMNGDLADRILGNLNEFKSFSQYADFLKTKNYTRTGINRALIHTILSITKGDLEKALHPEYVRILGFRKESEELLSEIKKRSSVHLIPKPSALSPGKYDRDLFASNLYETVQSSLSGKSFRHEYTRQIVII